MPTYYIIGGGIELGPISYNLNGMSFEVESFDTVSSELLVHCLNQEFQFRCCDRSKVTEKLVLFSDKEEAQTFSTALSDKATVATHKKYYPVFEVEIDKNYTLKFFQGNDLHTKLPEYLKSHGFNGIKQNWNCCLIDEAEAKTLKNSFRISSINLPDYEQKENIYFPKILIEEAKRPLFDRSFFICWVFTFWTVIIPIIYTIYRLLKSSDANAALTDKDRQKFVDTWLGYRTYYIKDTTARFAWIEKPSKAPSVISAQPEPTLIDKFYEVVFPKPQAEERLKKMFPDLTYRICTDLSYKQLKIRYCDQNYWDPKKYKLLDEAPSRATKKQGSPDEIKNEVTNEPMLELCFNLIGLESNTWAMPVSQENAPIIRQMIKVNYCNYFADKNGVPTKNGKLVKEELDKIEFKLNFSVDQKTKSMH